MNEPIEFVGKDQKSVDDKAVHDQDAHHDPPDNTPARPTCSQESVSTQPRPQITPPPHQSTNTGERTHQHFCVQPGKAALASINIRPARRWPVNKTDRKRAGNHNVSSERTATAVSTKPNNIKIVAATLSGMSTCD